MRSRRLARVGWSLDVVRFRGRESLASAADHALQLDRNGELFTVEQRIRERYSEDILSEAIERYGIDPDRIRLLDGFESFIYEFERGGEEYILRIGHSLRRSEALICGEVDWISFLSDGGASVARAVPSDMGKLVEHVDDGAGGHFLATAFVKARGVSPWKAGWTHELYERYGALIGRMHVLSRDYVPADPVWTRPHWNDPIMLDVERFLPASDGAVVERYRELTAHLDGLPRDVDSYGLIHQDAHGGNMFVDEDGRITLFDFDDCAYSWYANDIAIVLFYAVSVAEDPPAFTWEFMKSFLEGYRNESRIDHAWWEDVPHFLKLREIDLYAVIHRSFDVENLDDPWCSRFMDGRSERIAAGVPYLDFDFSLLAER
jgi:Ser/Thr protein kinase RdoA (MazF antagonist)